MTDNDAKRFLEIQLKQYNLFLKKNKAYGRSYQDYGPMGVLIRMNDKINRLRTISASKIEIDTGDESVIDSVKDLGNYCILCLMEIQRLTDEMDNNINN
jgi:hypothetical protein